MPETPEAHRERGKRYYQANKDKITAKNKAWRLANYERSLELARTSNRKSGRAAHLKARYGLTLDQVQELANAQEGRCAVCGDSEPLTVDHDHQTGLIRGLLCGSCNRALGLFRERRSALYGAVAYLDRASRYLAALES